MLSNLVNGSPGVVKQDYSPTQPSSTGRKVSILPKSTKCIPTTTSPPNQFNSISRPSKPRKNDLSKKLADQRWRRSMNECYETLRSFVERDICLYDGTQIKGKEVRSKNDLLSKTRDLIVHLENQVDALCSISCESLTLQDKAYKLKFKMKQSEQEDQQSAKIQSARNI